MNWMVILVTAILSVIFSEALIGDIATKSVVLIVAILLFSFIWACYGMYIVAGG